MKKIEVCGNVLFLQGPMGSFFSKFNRYLASQELETHKIDFNLGDCLFGSYHYRNFYKGEVNSWGTFFTNYIHKYKINTVFVFSLSKIFHRIARTICMRENIMLYVFEEGYLRPDFITLEPFGVNGASSLSKNPKFYLDYQSQCNFQEQNKIASVQANSATYFFGLCRFFSFSYIYYGCLIFSRVFSLKFSFHKKMNIKTLWAWHKTLFSFVCNQIIPFINKKTNRWINEHQGNFFCVPLQVHDDSQITLYSQYEQVEDFITEVLQSFARYANKKHYLLIKHHPFDKGHVCYKKYIKHLARKLGLSDRVKYTYNADVLLCLKKSLGLVLINSTMGLSALHHNKPIICMAKSAIYNLKGLTFQGSLHLFWNNLIKPQQLLYQKFKQYLLETNQIKGSFYYKTINFEDYIICYTASSVKVATKVKRKNLSIKC